MKNLSNHAPFNSGFRLCGFVALLCFSVPSFATSIPVVNSLPRSCSGTSEVYVPIPSRGEYPGVYRCQFGSWVFMPPLTRHDLDPYVSLAPSADQTIRGEHALILDTGSMAINDTAAISNPWDPPPPTLLLGEQAGVAPLEIHAAHAVGISMYSHSSEAFRAPTIYMLKSRGTQSSPLAVQNGDGVGQLYGGGYDGANYQAASSNFGFVATENWRPGANGTKWALNVIPNGTTTSTVAIAVDNTTFVGLGNLVHSDGPNFQLETSGESSVDLGIANSAPSDALIQHGQFVPYLDEAGNNLKFRVRYVTGAFHLATIPLDTPHTPATAFEACAAGTIAWDANFVYVCVATNTWRRSALSAW